MGALREAKAEAILLQARAQYMAAQAMIGNGGTSQSTGIIAAVVILIILGFVVVTLAKRKAQKG